MRVDTVRHVPYPSRHYRTPMSSSPLLYSHARGRSANVPSSAASLTSHFTVANLTAVLQYIAITPSGPTAFQLISSVTSGSITERANSSELFEGPSGSLGGVVGFQTDGEIGLFALLRENRCMDVKQIMYGVGDWTLRMDVQLIYSSIYALIFVVGLVGNGLLIGTIRKRMTVANVFLINLATSDLLLCITALPITPVLAFMKSWIFGSIMCKLVPLCQAISVLISSYCLCLIAVDRYRSIVTPLQEPWNIAEAQALMALCWMCAVAISSPLFIMQRLQPIAFENITLCGEFCGEYNWPKDDTRIKLAYGIAILIVQYLIPASIMAFCYWKILQKVRQDWIVNTGSMLTEAQQAQTSMRKRRVMYVLILMVAVFMGSWMPLTIVNILRDIGSDFLDKQMYFKLLTAHALAMTSIVSNPLLYFWMSKRHRRALKDDMFWFTNVRRQHTQQMGGLLERFAPSPSVGIMYRKSIERHLLNPNYNPYRRGTLADPTCMNRERALEEMHANCFLLVPLMPLCVPAGGRSMPAPRPGTTSRDPLSSRQHVIQRHTAAPRSGSIVSATAVGGYNSVTFERTSLLSSVRSTRLSPSVSSSASITANETGAAKKSKNFQI